MKKLLLLLLALLVGMVVLAASDQLEPKNWLEVAQYALPLLPALIAAIVKGFQNWPVLITSKTFWGGVSGILYVIQQFMAGNISPPTAVFGILVALTAVFLRDAQASASKPTPEAEAGPSRRRM